MPNWQANAGCEGDLPLQNQPPLLRGKPMIKKLALAGGALALLSSVTMGLPLFSYARCGVNYLKETTSGAMPMEWELKRARQMIVDLKPEIEANAKQIAYEKIEVARLQKPNPDWRSLKRTSSV
jgi:hypothetical protein